MHSPASNNDKDTFELSVTSEPSVGWGVDEMQIMAEAQRAWLQLAAGVELNLAILSYLRIMNLTFELTFY